MSTYKTVCPHCQAAFKITKEQLGLRQGKARCGKCSSIFQASDHLIPLQPSTPPPAPQPTAQQTHTPQQTQTSVSSPRVAGGEATASVMDSNTLVMSDMDALFNDESLKRNVSQTQELEIPDDALIDDNIAIEEKQPETPDDMNIFGDGELSDDFNDTLGGFSAITEHQLIEEPAPAKVNDDQWIEQLLSEDTSNASGNATGNANYTPRSSDTQGEPDDLVSFLEDIGAHTAQFSAIQPHQLQQDTHTTSATNTALSAQNLDEKKSLRASNAKSTGTGATKQLLSFVFWLLLSLVMLATLAAQYLYFNFDKMVYDKSNHDLLSSACGIVGCSLPTFDAAKVTITEKQRAKDDSNASWTRVKFVIKNDADEPMLLPYLKITLTKNDKFVAGNVIAPDAYLQGSHKRLPRLQPIDGDIIIKQPMASFDDYRIEPIY